MSAAKSDLAGHTCTIQDDATSALNWYRKYVAPMDRDKYPRRRDLIIWLRMTNRFSIERVDQIEVYMRQMLAKRAAKTRRRKNERLRKEALVKAQQNLF